jgi:hypothetical protein
MKHSAYLLLTVLSLSALCDAAETPTTPLVALRPLYRAVLMIDAAASRPKPSRSAITSAVDSAVIELRLSHDRLETREKTPRALVALESVIATYSDAAAIMGRVTYLNDLRVQCPRCDLVNADALVIYEVGAMSSGGRALKAIAEKYALPITETVLLSRRTPTYGLIPNDSATRVLKIAAAKFADVRRDYGTGILAP